MENQASVQLINLAEKVGLKEARRILGIPQPGDVATESPQAPEPVVPVNPPDFVAPAAQPVPTSDESPENLAARQRQAENDGAQNATAAQLKAALQQLGISYPGNAKKADLLALFLARP